MKSIRNLNVQSLISTLFLLVCLLGLPDRARTQSSAGEVNGTVSDPSGRVVPDCRVKLANQQTNLVREAISNSAGYYLFINVQPGRYVVSVEQQGFMTLRTGIFDVGVNQSVSQPLVLTLGSVSQTVTASADAEMLEMTSSARGTVISEQAVHDLPLNGRNFTQLLTLTPGATPVATSQGASVGTQDASISAIPGSSWAVPAINGQESRSSLYFMDGFINSDLRGSLYGVLPIIDLIQEFKVNSHNDRAEYGGASGGFVSVVSKSGGNLFHGSAWEFLRNNDFDSRDTFTQSKGPAPFRQNEFGATFGGPVIRNRTFFYAGYEGWRYRRAMESRAVVPTPQELAGDFSQSILKQNIFNPYSTRPDPTRAGAFIRDPFPGNQVSPSLISKPMQQVLSSYIKAPNLTGVPGFTYLETRGQSDDADTWQIKVDHRINDQDQLFFRLTQMWVTDVLPVTGTVETATSTYHGYNYGGGWSHIIRPNLLLNVTAGYLTKPYVFFPQLGPQGATPIVQAGFTNADQFGGMVINMASPYISSIGNQSRNERNNPAASLDAGISWVHGGHNIKVGGQYIYWSRLTSTTNQVYTFANGQTANPAAGATGSSLASALLGLPSSFAGQNSHTGDKRFRLGAAAVYFQDEWKVKPKLTISLGLRYDMVTKPQILNNRLMNTLDVKHSLYLISASSVPLCSSPAQVPCLPAPLSSIPFGDHIKLVGDQFPADGPIYDNLGPRAGMAWNFRPSWVLRAGFGVAYSTIAARSQYFDGDIGAAPWPYGAGFSGQTNSIGAVLQPITSIQGNFPNPVPAATPWAAMTAGGRLDQPGNTDARSQEWNVELQKAFTPKIMLSVAYVGSRTGRLQYTGYGNAAVHPSPNGTASAVIDQLKPMPFVDPAVYIAESIGSSSYNSLQVKLEKRFANGLQSLLSYTWSKSLDNSSGWFGVEDGKGGQGVQDYFNPSSNRGPSGFDVPHFLSWATLWEVPLGPDRRWLHQGPLSSVVGGWQLNYVFQVRSGQDFNLVVPGDPANIAGTQNDLSNYARPNLVGDPIPAHQTAAQWYNPKAFSIPSGSYGNFGRNVLRASHVVNLDFSVFKNIRVAEHHQLQLRVEALNLLNIQNYGVPGTTIGNASAGIISSVSVPARQLQLALKYAF